MTNEIQKIIIDAIKSIVVNPGYIVDYDTKYEPTYKSKSFWDTKDSNLQETMTITIKIIKKDEETKINGIDQANKNLPTNSKPTSRRRRILNQIMGTSKTS